MLASNSTEARYPFMSIREDRTRPVTATYESNVHIIKAGLVAPGAARDYCDILQQ